tara:strand:- start:2291 stop:3913 length:1623 start_codon:yes stop_codon:yes gene_type:complete
LKKIEPRFIAGPPGTGKTHTYIVEELYPELLLKYHPDKIIILSHTNVAADQIKDAILALPAMKERGFTKKSMKYKICTIHSYCKNRLLHKDKFEYEDHKNLIIQNRLFGRDSSADVDKHTLYKFRSDAKGRGMTYDEYWRVCDQKSYKPYSIELIKELLPIYEKYKKDNNKCDYTDMIEDFNHPDVREPDIDAVIIDECQDSNVPQSKAIEKMAFNVKDGHYYLVGDADQTLFEYAGSNADKYHKLAAHPYKELKEGLRCSEAINKLCKKIIQPIWDHYGSHRIWTPARYTEKHNMGHIGEVIKGNSYYLSNFEGSSHLDILLDKIKNTNQTFLFTYRGTPGNIRCTEFFDRHGLEYAHVKNSAHVSKKELRAHHLWPEFVKGVPMRLLQIKHFWEYIGSKVIIRGKADPKIFDGWREEDYTIDNLITKGLLKPDCKQYRDFDLIRVPSKTTKEKLIYIKKVLAKGFDFDKNIQIKYGNIHEVKGLTFDNVIVDHTLTRREDWFTQLRLAYTAYSRGIFDYWTLAKSPGKYKTTLGGKNE